MGPNKESVTSLTSVDWSTLPIPIDDGAADHLEGLNLPSVPLAATNGTSVDLASLPGLTVVYAYPMTGRPDTPLPEDWDMIPGARGCTPQSCAFRDHFAELTALGVNHLFGLSVQPTDYQQEAATRLHLPFPLLSDADYQFTDRLTLPTFESSGIRLLKRLTLIIRDGQIIKAFYPVLPPDQNAQAVMDWLISQS
jgi:hypothetical protein